MSSVRAVASRVARNIASDSRVARLLCLLNGRARIISLHGVGMSRYPVDVFRAQLRFLTHLFRIVPLDEVLEPGSAGGDRRPKVALTFDDGLRNNFTVACPVLREFGAPATFFVCPGLVESRRWIWNFDCRARLARMSREQRRAYAAELEVESPEIEPIIARLKYLPYAKRVAGTERLARLVPDLVPTEAERLEYDLMTWEELEALDPSIVTIGGHSTHHEILTRLEPEHLEREVAECKVLLERQLGRPIRHFCYPDGAHDARVVDCVGRYFETAVTTRKGYVARRPARLELPRISMGYNVRDLAWRVHRPTG